MTNPPAARPFQLGDVVRITDEIRRLVSPGVQYVFEGVVSKIDPAAEPDSGHDYGPYLWIDTAAFKNGSGETFTRTFCPLTNDMTRGSDEAGRSIELLWPAPVTGDESV
jgi:hypothetical protein